MIIPTILYTKIYLFFFLISHALRLMFRSPIRAGKVSSNLNSHDILFENICETHVHKSREIILIE